MMWRCEMKLIRMMPGVPSATPAAEKTACTGPWTWSSAASIAESSLRSTLIVSATGKSTGAWSMTTTSPPSAAVVFAAAAPIPVAPPTTSTRFPS